jgi:uncharacterized protein YbjT (DUF2867 family)
LNRYVSFGASLDLQKINGITHLNYLNNNSNYKTYHFMSTYVITGATGHTGKPIALGLLAEGHTVRVISRSAEKAKELTDKGAILFNGDTTQVDFLKNAFNGADAAYVMIPFDMATTDYTGMQVTNAKAIGEALTGSTVKYAVTLSSVGAHLTEGAGVVQGLERMEKIMNAIPGLNVRHLRASYFMENTMVQVQTIKFMGAMASPVLGDVKVPMVTTSDIAAVALKRLLALDFSGKSHEYILGQRDVTYNEIARVFGEVIGMPDLKYNAVGYDDAKNAMVMMGMGQSVATRLVEFVKVVNEGRVMGDAVRTPENTTPTSIEQFAHIFKHVYES